MQRLHRGQQDISPGTRRLASLLAGVGFAAVVIASTLGCIRNSPTPTSTGAPGVASSAPTTAATQALPATPTVAASPQAVVSPTPGVAPPAASTSQTAASNTPGPTRPSENAYRLVRTLDPVNFSRMLGFAAMSGANDQAAIITKTGQIWLVSLSGAAAPKPFGDISDRLIKIPGQEEGLLGMAFSPHFQADTRLFLYYTADNPRRNVLSRFTVVNGVMDMNSEIVLLELPKRFSNHNGGQLAFGPDGYLYVGVGDEGSGGDPLGNGQNLSVLFAKILRLDVSGDRYKIPPDNPFVNKQGARPETFAYGLRNPWRFSFDKATGNLWVGDVGQDKWEEIDRVVAAGNYGWSIMEGFECYRPQNCDKTGLQLPRAVYGHDLGCAVISGHVYRGLSMSELSGWFIYGDYCSGSVWGVNTADNSPPVLLTNSGLPITSVGELPNGELVIVTFANAIYTLQRSS